MANTAIKSVGQATNQIADHIEKGDLARAQALCTDLLSQFPDNPDALHAQAMLCQASGDMVKAIQLLQRAVGLAPNFETAWYNLGVCLEQVDMFEEACKVYQHLLGINAKHHQALFNLAHIMHRAGHLQDAEVYYRRVLEITPYHSNANGNLGGVLIDQKRFDEALSLCEKAVMLALDNVTAFNNCGIIYAQRGDMAKAEKAFKRALTIAPNYIPAKQNLEQLQAMGGAAKASTATSGDVEALFAQANAHLAAQRVEDAAVLYRQILAAKPDQPEALINLGMALTMMRQFADAEETIKRAIALSPQNANAYLNLGNVYKDQWQCEPAVAAYKQAIAYKRDFFEAWVNLGMMLRELKRHAEAMEAYQRALSLDPKKMLAINPAQVEALGMLIREQQQLCLWDNLDAYTAQLLKIIDAGTEDTGYGHFSTSTMLVVDSSAEQQYTSAKKCSDLRYGAIARPYDPQRPLPRASRTGKKIRIGYLSGDFYHHATSFLIVGLFEQHDRAQFEIYGYSYGKDDGGEVRARIQRGMDHFRDIRSLSDAQAAAQISDDGIDILVDLKGYTRDHRLGIPALRPAPVNVHYLGYPGTTGASFMDYFLADRVTAPESVQRWFAEKLVYVPHSYQANDNRRRMAAVPSRIECGLPEEGLVFCSFNQNYKITPRLFDVWMRLLASVPNSVLWLYITADVAQDNLRGEAQKRGIDPSRLIFATYQPQPEHLARLGHADIFLDTYPINAHTTASDALWCGVPVVTLAGDTFVSRVAASLLSAVGLSELVTRDIASYEALVLSLARDPARLAALKARLKEAQSTAPLFDTAATTRAIEAAYLGMIRRYEAGSRPEIFSV